MAWGILSGLGRGLERASAEPQQYYQNTRQQMLEDSQLENQALNRALQMASGMQQAERHPLEMQGLQSVLESQALQRRATQFGMGKDIFSTLEGRGIPVSPEVKALLGDLGFGSGIGADGTIDYRPLERQRIQQSIDTDKAQADAARTSAGASWRNSEANMLEAEARKKYYEQGGRSSAMSSVFSRMDQDPEVNSILAEMRGVSPYLPDREATLAGLQQRLIQAREAAIRRDAALLKFMNPESGGDIEQLIKMLSVQNALGGAGAPTRTGAPAPGGIPEF